MARYFLHVTDGTDFVADRRGIEIENPEQIANVAFGSALSFMRSLPAYREWSRWVVAVHDEDGFQAETVEFPDARVFSDLLWQSGSETAPRHVPVLTEHLFGRARL